MRSALALLVMLGSLVPAVASRPNPASTTECVSPRVIPGVGRACPVPGGYLVPTVDGRMLFTHGGDPLPSNNSSKPFSYKRKPSCVSRPGAEFHARVMYVVPSDRKNRGVAYTKSVQNMVYQVNGWMYLNARLFKRSVDMRVLCSGGSVSVKVVQVPTKLEQTSFSSVANDLIELGYANPLAKYWIYFDGRFPGAPGGTGSFANSGTPSPENRSNMGAQYAVTWGNRSSLVMMHENGHNMGAVLTSAPRTTGAGHCTDGRDIMCYPDNGQFASKYSGSRCDIEYYDCGFNDYFNPKPKANSFLATHWNIASPANRFIAGCMYRHGVLTAPAPADDPEAILETARAAMPSDVRPDPLDIFSRKHTVSKSCWGRPFSASAIIQPPTATASTGNVFADSLVDTVYAGFVPGSALASDVDVCFYKKSALMTCAGSGRFESGKIPTGATDLRMILRGAGPAIYVFNAV